MKRRRAIVIVVMIAALIGCDWSFTVPFGPTMGRTTTKDRVARHYCWSVTHPRPTDDPCTFWNDYSLVWDERGVTVYFVEWTAMKHGLDGYTYVGNVQWWPQR